MRYSLLRYLIAVLTYNLLPCLPFQILHAPELHASFNLKVQHWPRLSIYASHAGC